MDGERRLRRGTEVERLVSFIASYHWSKIGRRR
jgi:hypothetical protein